MRSCACIAVAGSSLPRSGAYAPVTVEAVGHLQNVAVSRAPAHMCPSLIKETHPMSKLLLATLLLVPIVSAHAATLVIADENFDTAPVSGNGLNAGNGNVVLTTTVGDPTSSGHGNVASADPAAGGRWGERGAGGERRVRGMRRRQARQARCPEEGQVRAGDGRD